MPSLIDEVLAEQHRLQTPAARFGRAPAAPAGAAPRPLYRDLIPLTAPGPGEQYAFEVDLDACTGCKACVAACHSLNGLEEAETWRDTGLLIGGDAAEPYQQTVTTACHHCVDPACLNGCPVLAYEKDPVTGIVRHLDDQCIGCQYCVLKCPYDVPKFNARLGIVRKCDLCHDRLGAGEAPACAQACPTSAIRVVTTARGGGAAAESFLRLGAPDPAYTRPTTRYHTRRPLPANLEPADAALLRPQPAHAPLVVMLVLTQLSVGLLAAGLFGAGPAARADFRLAGLAAFLGLAASGLHLGQPTKAWRSFLGWRRSWLSREVLAFGAYLGALGAAAAGPGRTLAAGLALVLGAAGVACSAMVYADTRRRAWRWPATAARFAGTVMVSALAPGAPTWAAVVLGLKLAGECRTWSGGGVPARLGRGPLRAAVGGRFLLGAAAAGLLAAGRSGPGLVLALAGELAERRLFFRSVDAPKMPGMAAR